MKIIEDAHDGGIVGLDRPGGIEDAEDQEPCGFEAGLAKADVVIEHWLKLPWEFWLKSNGRVIEEDTERSHNRESTPIWG
jgi:hypothetical protein